MLLFMFFLAVFLFLCRAENWVVISPAVLSALRLTAVIFTKIFAVCIAFELSLKKKIFLILYWV